MINKSERHVYCSGIDPSIVQLDNVCLSDTENFKSWVKSNVYYNHTHDVRSILIADNQLISGGVDTKIVFKYINQKTLHSTVRRYNSMPQKSIVQTCDDFVLLQHDKHLELWKLGSTGSELDLSSQKDGDCLPILRAPRKFLHLNSKSDLNIVCASLGSHPNNKDANTSHVLWLSYSDLNVIHIYRIEISSKQLLEPNIKIDKIKSLPLACGNRPAVMMKFYSYQSNESTHLRLCYLTNKSCLQCLKLVNDEIGFALECSIQCIPQDLLLTDNRVCLMAFKDDYVATADTDLNLVIWSLKSQQQLCTLPRYESLTACMSFHPKKNYLLVCYANRRIIEYDFELNEYTDWSRETSDKLPRQWLKPHSKLTSCFYARSNTDKIITHDEQYLVVIDKNEKMPEMNEKIFQQQLTIKPSRSILNGDQGEQEINGAKKHALHISDKFRVSLV